MSMQFPLIKVELEHMKQSIVAALNTYNIDTTSYVEAALTDVVETFDYGSIVSSVATEVLTKGIESYFRWGEGRVIIEKAIQEALNIAFGKSKDE